MTIQEIALDPEALYQIQFFNATVGGVTRRLRLEVRHLTYTDKWYLSVINAQTGESYCRYIPLVASDLDVELNDLTAVYRHKDIGWFCCAPITGNTTSEDPQENNLNEFALFWGDGFD